MYTLALSRTASASTSAQSKSASSRTSCYGNLKTLVRSQRWSSNAASSYGHMYVCHVRFLPLNSSAPFHRECRLSLFGTGVVYYGRVCERGSDGGHGVHWSYPSLSSTCTLMCISSLTPSCCRWVMPTPRSRPSNLPTAVRCGVPYLDRPHATRTLSSLSTRSTRTSPRCTASQRTPHPLRAVGR